MVFLPTNPECRTVAANQTENYHGIDLVKFLCAIMVFTIHISPIQGDVSGFSQYLNFGLRHFICRLAVPFYFVSSGFFLFKKMSPYNLNTDAVKSYCFKILRLFGVWNLLLFVGATGHLWYLGATVVAVTLLSVCLHFRIRLRYIGVLACLFYMVGLLGDSYHGLIAPLKNITVFNFLHKGYFRAFSTTRNGVFMGFIFVFMGAVFSWYKMNLRPRTALIGLVVSMFCLLVEVFVLKYNDIPIDYNMYLFLLPTTYFLFSFACTIQLKNCAIYKHLRNIGMLIYFLHMFIYKFVSLAMSVFEKCCGVNTKQHLYIVTLFLTLFIAVFIDWLSCKNKFKWIKWFLS